MNLLAPPTDSLYKFCAIGSLVVCISLMLWHWHEADVLEERIYLLGLEAARANVDARLGAEEMERLKVQRQQAKDGAGAARVAAREAAIARELVPKAAERRYKLYWIEKLARRLKHYGIAVNIIVGLFGGMSGFSFWIWYIKVQRYQDEILRLHVEAARRSIESESLKSDTPSLNSA